jgi:hypothetical protein
MTFLHYGNLIESPETRAELGLGAARAQKRPGGHAAAGALVSVPTIASGYEPVTPIALPTLLKVVLALLPSVAMAAIHTTMISANMTAYSTAVGPSSRRKKSTTHNDMRENMVNS